MYTLLHFSRDLNKGDTIFTYTPQTTPTNTGTPHTAYKVSISSKEQNYTAVYYIVAGGFSFYVNLFAISIKCLLTTSRLQ